MNVKAKFKKGQNVFVDDFEFAVKIIDVMYDDLNGFMYRLQSRTFDTWVREERLES